MKLAVIGGGSTYTPELADGLARLAPGVTEVVLVDPDAERLAAVGPVSQRIMRRYGHQAVLRWTDDPEDGIEGAAAVLIQLRVGGQATRHRDETWPQDFCCLGQETTGAGGLAKAMRTIPLVLDIAEIVRRRALPHAWIIDFTNPVGMVTRALLDAGHRAVGLCNVAIGLQRYFASLLDVAPESVLLDHVGLNHLTWERAAVVDGTDRLPELISDRGDEIAGHVGSPRSVLDDHGFVPSYYLRYYYFHDEVVDEQRKSGTTRAQAVMEVENELLKMYADPDLDTKPEILSRRGGAFYSEAAVALLSSLVSDARDVQVVNVRNQGTFGFLDDSAVIEVPAVVGSGGPVPVTTPPLSPLTRGLVAHMSAYEELAVEAALRGGRERVASALLAHPLVGQYPVAEKMTDRLLAENADFLPWTLSPPSSPLTGETARPRSRSSLPTGRCSRRCAGRAPVTRPTASTRRCGG